MTMDVEISSTGEIWIISERILIGFVNQRNFEIVKNGSLFPQC